MTTERRAVKVRIDAADLDAFEVAVAGLAEAGLTVRHVLPDLGLVAGEAEDAAWERLRAVANVRAVEREGRAGAL